MATITVKYSKCGGTEVIKHGVSESGFQLEHVYIGNQPGINEKMMAANASGIRDTLRVLDASQK